MATSLRRLPTIRRDVYQMNFERLAAVLGPMSEWPEVGEMIKLQSRGYMDLTVERLMDDSPGIMVLSLAHYGVQNGDMMRDPEMEVRITDRATVEALTFRNDYMGLNQIVYPTPTTFRPRLKKELNSFLTTWLQNLKAQGHKRAAPPLAA